MAIELRDRLLTRCAICLKRETPKRHDLLCGACVHDRIEIIRNSVIENEQLIRILRDDVNGVFEACEAVRNPEPTGEHAKLNGSGESTQSQVEGDSSNVKVSKSPKPGPLAVKQLALQLQKLDIVNTRARIAGILRTHESLAEKVSTMEKKISELNQQIELKKNLIGSKQDQLTENFIAVSDTLDMETFRLQGNGMRYVLKQAATHQLRNFQVLREVAFSNIDRYKAGVSGLRSSRGKNKLEIFSQPVIPQASFLSYNNKLETINTYLENLIYLQVLICDLLRANGVLIELPYLQALEKLLPDSNFYDLVQKKINLILEDTGTPGAQIIDDVETPENVEVGTGPQVVLATDGKDKIVIKDNVIHIPISFRTVNLQRRLSLRSPTKESLDYELEKITQNGVYESSPTNTSPSPKSKAKSPRSVLAGKQFVMVPHKILNKPFTRLLTEEYLRFLLVVSKIIINFHILLRRTIDRVPEKKLNRHASNNSLASTINQLRFNGGLLSSMILPNDHTDKESGICDFEKILARLADLDIYFKYLEQEQVKQLDKERLSRSTSSVGLSLQPSLTRLGQQSQYTEDSSDVAGSYDKINSLHVTPERKTSKFKIIYNTLFGKPQDSDLVPKEDRHGGFDENIYGLVSETELDLDDPKNSTESIGHNSNDTNPTIAKKVDDLDPRQIMKTVYMLIARGSGGSRAQSLGSATDEAIRSATFLMMEQSRHQLDDWDVLSRVF